jgi:hypothetical protein
MTGEKKGDRNAHLKFSIRAPAHKKEKSCQKAAFFLRRVVVGKSIYQKLDNC